MDGVVSDSGEMTTESGYLHCRQPHGPRRGSARGIATETPQLRVEGARHGYDPTGLVPARPHHVLRKIEEGRKEPTTRVDEAQLPKP